VAPLLAIKFEGCFKPHQFIGSICTQSRLYYIIYIHLIHLFAVLESIGEAEIAPPDPACAEAWLPGLKSVQSGSMD
jgi:hypothetical protein